MKKTRKTKVFELHGFEVRAKNVTEAMKKSDEVVRRIFEYLSRHPRPLTFMHRGYCGVVCADFGPDGGHLSMIVAPDGARRAFSTGSAEPVDAIKQLAEHIRSIARDELGSAGADPDTAARIKESDERQLAGYTRGATNA